MTDLKKAERNPQALFWEELDDVTAGMLGVEGMKANLQTMSHHAEPARGKLWFVTRKDAELVAEVGQGATARYVVVGDDHDFHACASGPIRQNRDEKVLDDLWNPVVASWFEQGRDDPQLVMLEMDLREADVWASTDSATLFGWEIAKANLKGGEPDVGVRTRIDFAVAA